jgi:hypothetical protein
MIGLDMAKALGGEIKEFYENHWPVGYYHEDNALQLHDEAGAWILEPNVKYNLADLGYLIPEKDAGYMGGKLLTFQEAFNKWAKQRNVDIIVLRVPKDARSKVEEFVASLPGAKII